MLDLYSVINAPTDKLATAITGWSNAITKMEETKRKFEEQLIRPVTSSGWKGEAATAGTAFMKKVTSEVDDAIAEAKGIRKILTEANNAIKTAQTALTKIVEEEAQNKRLYVDSKGKVFKVNDYEGTHTPEEAKKKQAQIDDMERRIKKHVSRATEADTDAAWALNANTGKDKYNFSPPKHDTLKKADRAHAIADGNEAAKLLRQGDDLSDKELAHVNKLVRENRGNPHFATTFYENLGPEKTLQTYGQLSSEPGASEHRQGLLKDLQKNMGLSLATATEPGTKSHPQPHLDDRWTAEMRKLGAERIPMHKYDYAGPYGYQLLGGIMRYGNYDPKFLNPIAEHVFQLQAKDPDMFAETKSMVGTPGSHPFNPSGKNGAGYDPAVSMLEALGHSPEAAKQLFSQDPTMYNEDGTRGSGFPKDADGKPIKSYLDYFTDKDYEGFPGDIVGHAPDDIKKSVDYMPDALGHALQSATLGHAWDDPNPQLIRDETSAQIMTDVVNKFGDASILHDRGPMADSLGAMGAGYIDDVNWALNDNNERSMFAPDGYAGMGAGERGKDGHAEFGEMEIRKFLSTLGQHPDAYSTISTAERVYTSSMLDAQVGPDGKIDHGGAREAARTGSEVQGILDQSRANQVEAEGAKKDEEYNKALEKRSAWIKFGAGAAIGAGVAFLPATAAGVGAAAVLVPLGIETGSGAVTEKIGEYIGDWSESKQQDSTDDVQKDRNEIFQGGRRNAWSPVGHFLDHYRIEPQDAFAQDLETDVKVGYSSGILGEDQLGNRPQTD